MYFSIFGGLGWEIDMDEDLEILIDEIILDNYESLHKDITEVTRTDALWHAILTGVATSDRRTHSAFKRARVSQNEGEEALKELCAKGILTREHAKSRSFFEDTPVSDKLKFAVPFVRFWFAFVSPLFKGIKEGDFEEFHEKFANHKQEFVAFIYEELFRELVKLSLTEDPIVEMGSFWNKEVDFELFAKTKGGKVLAGTLKLSKEKMKKSELTKLQEKAASASITPHVYVLFSKSGFSNELKALKGANLKLFSLKNFKALLD
ncbi:MAG: DUF234 domain-containing protein [Thiovulaceae bacterium]|nr:DUF234 domain-containing protein [Sulfurimonadaceae bacterium]